MDDDRRYPFDHSEECALARTLCTVAGDGIHSGWRDLGLCIESSLTRRLAASFDRMFEEAARCPHRRQLLEMPRFTEKSSLEDGELLFSAQGPAGHPFKRRLRRDLRRARHVKIIAAYFLPTWRIRRELLGVVKRHGTVQLILAGKSDVLCAQMACRRLYHRLLRGGVQIYEYQPQILHAKLIVIDDIVYLGSANLDTRSLGLNYELVARFANPSLAATARQAFATDRARSAHVEWDAWSKSETWWKSLCHRWAYFLLTHLDPLIARWQWSRLHPRERSPGRTLVK